MEGSHSGSLETSYVRVIVHLSFLANVGDRKDPSYTKLSRPARISALNQLYRALGLRLICDYFGKKGEEAREIYNHGLMNALAANALHFIGISSVLVLFSLNIHTLYVGAISKVSWLQFISKAQEMVLQSSIANIALYFLRLELTSERETPYGAIFPILTISQLSSLWSSEFWGSVTARCLRRGWRWCFYLLGVGGCIVLANIVGPASAVFMIPRQAEYSVGSASTYFNASLSQMAPNHVNASTINPGCATVEGREQLSLTNCPNWEATRDFAGNGSPYNLNTATWVTTHLIANRGTATGGVSNSSTVATTEGMVVATALEVAVKNFWNISIQSNKYLKDKVSAVTQIKQPYAEADCRIFPFPVTDDSPETSPVIFGEKAQLTLDDFTTAEVQNATRENLEGTIIWKTVPATNLSDFSLLAVVIPPRDSSYQFLRQNDQFIQSFSASGGWHVASGCVIRAVWISTEIEITSSVFDQYGTIASQMSTAELEQQWNSAAQFPSISISTDWANYLLPSSNYTPSPLQAIFNSMQTPLNFKQGAQWPNHEILLSTLVVTGLATSLSYRVTNNINQDKYLFSGAYGWDADTMNTTTPYFYGGSISVPFGAHKDSTYPQSFPNDGYQLVTKFHVTGLVYNLEGRAVRVSMAILSLYLILALTFVIYSLCSRNHSSSWDTISELTALALRSPPPQRLEKTCSGINCFSTFGIPSNIKIGDKNEWHFHHPDSEDLTTKSSWGIRRWYKANNKT